MISLNLPFLRIWFATRFQRHHPIENIRSRQLVFYPCILLSMVRLSCTFEMISLLPQSITWFSFSYLDLRINKNKLKNNLHFLFGKESYSKASHDSFWTRKICSCGRQRKVETSVKEILL